MTLALLIQYVYIVHDMTTGTMILEEMLENVRVYEKETESIRTLEQKGKELGNPRLWLGEYQLLIESGNESVTGSAQAGAWKQEIQMPKFQPGKSLRRYEALIELGKELEDDNNGISARNESELYGDSS